MTETNYRIKEGDFVTVHFENVERIMGCVRSIPQTTGDCWVIEDAAGGEIHYVQTFARMTKNAAR